jgi:hypothetical protein
MIASGNKGWFPCSNQCAKCFLEEICGFSGHVSDRQAFAGGGKSRPAGGRRILDSRKMPFLRQDFSCFQGRGVIKVKILLNLSDYLLLTRLPEGKFS